jgi:hypothetical protein
LANGQGTLNPVWTPAKAWRADFAEIGGFLLRLTHLSSRQIWVVFHSAPEAIPN